MSPAGDRESDRGRATLLLFLAAAALAIVRSGPPSPRGADAPEGEFSAARALATLGRVLGEDGPRPVGSEAHARVRERLLEELRQVGLEPRVEDAAAGSSASIAVVRNVVARIPGREPAKSVLLSVHYDSVPAGPGAGDDGSGIATLLEVARALRAGSPLRRPIDLLFTDAEECGLVGAHAYARPSLAQDVEVVVNADARGTSGPTFLFETSPGNADLVGLYGRSVARPCATSAAYEVYKRMPNDTDLTVFKRIGLPGMNFAFIGGLSRYHTSRDDLEHLDPGSVQHEGDQVLALTRALAEEEYRAAAPGDLVYADVLGLFLLRWPEAWSLPLSIGILLALLALAVADARRKVATPGAIARGLALAPATIAAAAAAVVAIVRAVVLLRGDPAPWTAHPIFLAIAIVAGGFLLAELVRRIRWLEDADSSGLWILLALAGVAVAALVPGASYLCIAPCGAALLARLVPWARLRHAVPAVVLVLLWIPLLLGLVQALELQSPIAVALPLGVLIAAAGRTGFLLLLSAAAAVATVVALLVPAHSKDSPAWLNFVHVEVAGEPGAQLVAQAYGRRLPAPVRLAADFGASEERILPGVGWLPRGRAAPTSRSGAKPPELEVLSTRDEPEGRILELSIKSARGAPGLAVELRGLARKGAGDCGVLAVSLGGRKVRGEVWRCSDRPETHRVFFGVPSEGIRLQVRAPLESPAEILVLDTVYGLPPEDAAVASARPETHVPRGHGDQWVVARRFEL